MSIKEQLDADVKQAMLAGDKTLVTTLRGLKSAILDTEIAKSSRETGLGDEEVVTLFQKEAKKRQESADLYQQGGNQEKADAELAEKVVIEIYLPEQMGEAEIQQIVDSVITELSATNLQQMGQVIAAVRERTKGQADGAVIARLVKEKLQ
jgi:uncharacterized protein YqeY